MQPAVRGANGIAFATCAQDGGAGGSFLITAGKYVDVGTGNFVTQIYAKFHTLLHWRSTTKGVISQRTYISFSFFSYFRF